MIDFLIQINAIGLLEFFGTFVLFIVALGTIYAILGDACAKYPGIAMLVIFGIPVLFALRRIIIGLIQ